MRIGLNLPQYAVDFDGGECSYGRARDLARRAEAAGLDGVWLSDHPFVVAPDGSVCGALEPLATLAALSRDTSRIRLGTLVLAATMRPAVLVAAAAATVGAARVVCGIGAGWYAPEHRAYGIALPPLEGRAARLWDTVRALRSIERGPAVLIGGTSDAVLDCAAAGADEWNVAWDVPPDAYRALASRADRACERAGRDPATLHRSVGVTVAVGSTGRDLERKLERVRERAAYLRELSLEAIESRIVCGTPERCAERLAAYAASGVAEIVATPLLRDDEESPEALAGVAALVR